MKRVKAFQAKHIKLKDLLEVVRDFNDCAPAEVPKTPQQQEHRHWPGEVCKVCGRRNVIGFIVDDETWTKVMAGAGNVACPTCFDERAQAAGVVYTFQELYPVTWSSWGP